MIPRWPSRLFFVAHVGRSQPRPGRVTSKMRTVRSKPGDPAARRSKAAQYAEVTSSRWSYAA